MAKRILMMGLAAFLLGACGSRSKVGESCTSPSTTSDCEEGSVCTTGVAGSTCRKLCTDNSVCAVNETCTAIAGSNLKSCQST